MLKSCMTYLLCPSVPTRRSGRENGALEGFEPFFTSARGEGVRGYFVFLFSLSTVFVGGWGGIVHFPILSFQDCCGGEGGSLIIPSTPCRPPKFLLHIVANTHLGERRPHSACGAGTGSQSCVPTPSVPTSLGTQPPLVLTSLGIYSRWLGYLGR